MSKKGKSMAPRNRSISLSEQDHIAYKKRLVTLDAPARLDEVADRTVCQDAVAALGFLPPCSVDLLFADPPYNLTKAFNGNRFQRASLGEYEEWLDSWLSVAVRLLKPAASVYVCGDWRSSAAIHSVGARYFHVQTRITWEREKGRGSIRNWKNCSEDIWFFTNSESYTFNVDAVKLNRRVIAPYTTEDGRPKGWGEGRNGRFRLTHPSNIWTDITVPFWSMPENTAHPTQKPEKLLAKIILASSNEGDLVLDPFLGSGTTSVVARKLERRFIGIEIDEEYCCLAEKRLEMAAADKHIQGFSGGVFWERNTMAQQGRGPRRAKGRAQLSPR